MLNFSRAKTIAIWTVCLLGVLFSIPSLVNTSGLPSWVPQRHINLGLDLQGGSYLLMEVDVAAVEAERLEAVVDTIRRQLREAGIRYVDLAVRERAVSFSLVDATQAPAAREALKDLITGADVQGRREFDVAQEDGRFRLALSQAALVEKSQRAVEQSIEIIRRRIDETGVNEPVIARQGTNRVLVQLPGVSDPDRIKRLLGQTAKMTFRLLADDTLPPGSAAPPGTEWLESTDRAQPGRMLVRKRIEVDGATLTNASPSTNPQTGQWVVNFEFDSVGARRFGEVTKNNVGKPFAIVLDNKVISAPRINEPITGGRGQISGSFNAQSANDLAVLLRAGALPAPLTIVEERSVGPELGADSIRAGLIAIVAGVILVMGYMVLTYWLFGVFANIALIFNLFLTVACLSLLEATLTLPGIAGILLTLGMSVDANILINERIREEAKKGRTPLAALEAGYSRAQGTIVDANLTTLIKMIILYAVGTGTVRGFAVTISLGIITSMFTATMVARYLTAEWYKRTKPKVLGSVGWLRLAPENPKIQFMKGRHLGIALSVLLSTASVVLFFKPGLNYGIDFAGGIVMEIRTEQPADFPALRSTLEKLEVGPVALQQFGPPTDVIVRLERQEGGDQAQQAVVRKVQETLQGSFPGTQIRRVESVGASVSGELFEQGMLALALASVAMLVYITFRFEWQFGVGAVVTMLLDVTKTIGFFAVTGMQFNLTSVAAILTIMGFSINDKVVVYDRVRENLRLYRKMPLRELIDRSINETISRTISTSLAIFLSTLPLALFAAESLREFAWVLLFGVVLATSSSIFIAAPILLYLGEHRLRRPTEEEAVTGQPEIGGKAVQAE